MVHNFFYNIFLKKSLHCCCYQYCIIIEIDRFNKISLFLDASHSKMQENIDRNIRTNHLHREYNLYEYILISEHDQIFYF